MVMALATFSVRMDENLKKQFDSLCSEFGMNATTAVNVFARAVVRERRIPFEIQAANLNSPQESGLQAFKSLRQQAIENHVSDLILEEINQEINRTRNGKD